LPFLIIGVAKAKARQGGAAPGTKGCSGMSLLEKTIW